MVPSALPAFSAPTGVSVVPSAFASSAVTAACAASEPAAMAMPASQCRLIFMRGSSEGGLEGEAHEATVLQVGGQPVRGRHGRAVVLRLAHEVDVLEIEAVLLQHVGAQ